MDTILENTFLRVAFDINGNLSSIMDKRNNREYVKPHGLWRIIINEKESLEVEIKSENAQGKVEIKENTFNIHYYNLISHTGNHIEVEVLVSGCLVEENLFMDIKVHNHTEDNTVRECHFPIIAMSEDAVKMDYHHSEHGGCTWKNLYSNRDKINNGAPYKGMDYLYKRKISSYPGNSASTNCMALADKQAAFYFGCHDSEFTMTEHILELENNINMNLAMAKTCSLRTGESISFHGFIIAPCIGTWHKAADKYREWLEQWYEFKPIPDDIQNMQGWQRIIMRSQYGENFYKFPDMPQIYEDGIQAGIDTLFMFGWHQGGHDCDYPNYTPSEELGGIDDLRENVKKFQHRGGKVILYANGQLIDKNSEFYTHNSGRDVSIKDHRGNEPLQFYGFSGRGIFNRIYGNRTFVTACPSCKSWIAELKKIIDLAVEMDCDGVFFDQLGAAASLCCDPSHGHPVPYFGIMNARRELIKEIREYAKRKKPAMSFGIELISDITSQHADYIHSLVGGANAVNPDWEKHGQKPEVIYDMAWFRYILPEVILSNREIRDDSDIERRVNRMVMQNLKSDVEIYRCQKTITATPHYKNYLAQANKFRSKHARLLWGAHFRSDNILQNNNPEVDAVGHIAKDGSIVVIVTQSHLDSTSVKITVPGYFLTYCDFLGNAEIDDDGHIKLSRHGLALLSFKQSVCQ